MHTVGLMHFAVQAWHFGSRNSGSSDSSPVSNRKEKGMRCLLWSLRALLATAGATDGQCRICAGRKSSAHGADSGSKRRACCSRCCQRHAWCWICAHSKPSAHGAASGPKCCQCHACPQRTPAGRSRAGSAHEYGNDHSTRPKDRPAAWRGGSSRER